MSETKVNVTLLNGDVNGIWRCKNLAWNCIGYKIPKECLREFEHEKIDTLCGESRIAYNELCGSGVYILVGQDDRCIGGEIKVYVGESTNLLERFRHHKSKKPFWNKALAFCGSFEKQDIQQLEDILLDEISEEHICTLENENYSPGDKIEHDSEHLEIFSHIKTFCTLLGENIFYNDTDIHGIVSEYKLFSLDMEKSGVHAKGYFNDNGEEFVVCKGSTIFTGEPGKSMSDEAKKQWKHDKRQKYIVDGKYTRDTTYSKLSIATNVVTGTGISALKAWKDEKGNPIKEFLQRTKGEE